MFGFFKKSTDTTAPPPESVASELSWREKLKAGLARTRAQLGGKLKSIFSRGKVDDELLEELETLLLTSDVGMDATQHLLEALKLRAKRDAIEMEIDRLRDQKKQLAEDEYYRRLEQLMLRLAAVYGE